jgi:hypothetical protein
MTEAAASPSNTAPVGPGAFLRILGALLTALVVVALLRQRDHYPTGFWGTDSGLQGTPFHAQLVFLALGAVAVRYVRPQMARTIVIGEGLACLAAYGRWGLCFLGALAVWFFALEAPLAARIRPIVPLALIAGAGVLGALGLAPWSYLFSILFTPRLMMYAWEKWQRGWPRASLEEFALYFLSPVLVVFPPYVVIIPYYGSHAKNFQPRLSEHQVRRGLVSFGNGVVSIAAVYVVSVLVDKMPAGASPWVRFFFPFFLQVAQVGALGHVAFGLLWAHGFVDERPPVNNPFVSTSYVQVWNRFQTHQKDLQVSFFYAPVLFRLRHKNRYLAIFAATAVTMLAGNTLVHFFARYIYDLKFWAPSIARNYRFFFLSTVVLGATLSFQEWQRRTRWRAPAGAAGAIYGAVCWAATFAFTAFLVQ